MYEIRMCELVIDFYRDKIYGFKLRSLNLIKLQMEQLQKGKVDHEVFKEIITLDELIPVYETKIKELQFRRNKFIKLKESYQKTNLRQVPVERSGVQSYVFKGIRIETGTNPNLFIHRNTMLKFPPSITKNPETRRLTTS